MKASLQKLFWPILRFFETGSEPVTFKPSHRTILLVVGGLFLLLSIGVFTVGLKGEGYGFLLPGLVFSGASLVSLVVGFLGSDSAVARLWGTKK